MQMGQNSRNWEKGQPPSHSKSYGEKPSWLPLGFVIHICHTWTISTNFFKKDYHENGPNGGNCGKTQPPPRLKSYGEKPFWLLLDLIVHTCYTWTLVLWCNDVSFQSPSLQPHANGPKWRKLWKKLIPTSFEVIWKETLLVATRFYCIHMIYVDPCAMVQWYLI